VTSNAVGVTGEFSTDPLRHCFRYEPSAAVVKINRTSDYSFLNAAGFPAFQKYSDIPRILRIYGENIKGYFYILTANTRFFTTDLKLPAELTKILVCLFPLSSCFNRLQNYNQG
jgi:hypothetical protein